MLVLTGFPFKLRLCLVWAWLLLTTKAKLSGCSNSYPETGDFCFLVLWMWTGSFPSSIGTPELCFNSRLFPLWGFEALGLISPSFCVNDCIICERIWFYFFLVPLFFLLALLNWLQPLGMFNEYSETDYLLAKCNPYIFPTPRGFQLCSLSSRSSLVLLVSPFWFHSWETFSKQQSETIIKFSSLSAPLARFPLCPNRQYLEYKVLLFILCQIGFLRQIHSM